MKKYLPLLLPLAMLVLAAVLYVHFYVTFVRPPPPLTFGEKQMTEALFTDTKTQCTGRYLFEVPVSFANTLHNRAKIGNASITSKRTYRPVFEQQIRLREEELKKGHTVDPEDQPFLKQVYRLNDNAVIFDRNENESVPGFGRILEGHLYTDGVAFLVEMEIIDYSDPKYAKDRALFLRDGSSPSTAFTKPQKLAEMQDLLSRLSGRKDEEIPTQPGTCIADGFIRDGRGQPRENITFVYPHNNNFSLSVSTNTYLGDSTSMLERSAEIQPYLALINGRTLRKGVARIAGFNTDEWLTIAYPEDSEDVPSTKLMFLAINNEKSVNFHHPILDLTLSNHALPAPTYSNAQLVEIWDRITRTFRIRPGAF